MSLELATVAPLAGLSSEVRASQKMFSDAVARSTPNTKTNEPTAAAQLIAQIDLLMSVGQRVNTAA
jgi:hypothetical protein